MSVKTKIIQCIVPNLLAGEYQVDVDQTIQAGKDIQPIKKTMVFGVDAARFTLNATDIYSTYPPENTTGDYSNHLPHVVFNRRTLPWERTIDGLAPKYQSEGKEPVDCPPCPWMALLLFTEAEMKELNIVQTKIEHVIKNGHTAEGIIKPEIYKDKAPLKLMPWEKEEDSCMTIDIGADIFNSIIPSIDDLPYLAHSKKVSINHKDSKGIDDTETTSTLETYSIEVIGSRQNTSTLENSSEDMASTETIEVVKEIVTGDGYFSVILGNRLVREGGNYTAVLVSLEGYSDTISSKTKIEDKASVRMVVLAHWTFTNHGHKTFRTLLDHVDVKSMRVERTSSDLEPYLAQGYIPMKHKMKNGAKNISWYRGPFVPNEIGFDSFAFVPFTSSDGALRYHGDTGLMDVSVAAAWELGKMLALRNSEFTRAMVDWNTNPILNPNEHVDTPYNKADVIHWLEKDEIKKSNTTTGFVAYKPYPKVVTDFLKDLAALKNVPISYLIPDKKYVAHDSDNNAKGKLNIFYIDPLWIYALLEGAVSLLSKNHTQTRYNISNIIKEVYYFKGSTKSMGFVLHSPLVSGWRGIEIKVYEANSAVPLNLPIRFERILPDLFLGIFPDTIAKIEVIQPYEGLHFGVKVAGDIGYYKLVKDKSGKTSNKNKIILEGTKDINDKSRVNIQELAKKMKSSTADAVFTSAEFSYQMIDSPILATFEIKAQNQ